MNSTNTQAMSDNKDKPEREAFEAEYRRHYGVPSNAELNFPDVPSAWAWWQKGRAALSQTQAGEIPPPDPCFVCGDSAVSCARKYHRLQDVGNPAPAAQCELCEGTGRIDETMGGSLPGVSDAACPRCAAKIGDHSLCSAHKQPAPANGNEWRASTPELLGELLDKIAPPTSDEWEELIEVEIESVGSCMLQTRRDGNGRLKVFMPQITVADILQRVKVQAEHVDLRPAPYPAHGEPGALEQGGAL